MKLCPICGGGHFDEADPDGFCRCRGCRTIVYPEPSDDNSPAEQETP